MSKTNPDRMDPERATDKDKDVWRPERGATDDKLGAERMQTDRGQLSADKGPLRTGQAEAVPGTKGRSGEPIKHGDAPSSNLAAGNASSASKASKMP